IMPLDLNRRHCLFDFAPETAIRAVQEKSAGELHRDRARALHQLAVHHVAPRRFGDARKIHAPVVHEVPVFCGNNRVLQNFGDLIVGQQNSALQGETADGRAVIGIKFSDHIGPVIFEFLNLRQVAAVNKQQPNGRAKRNRAKNQQNNRDAAECPSSRDANCALWRIAHSNSIVTQPSEDAWKVPPAASPKKTPEVNHSPSKITASASISSSISGDTKPLTCTIVHAGRIFPKTSPCARPILSQSAIFATNNRVRTTCSSFAPAFVSADSIFFSTCTACAYA